MKQLGLVFLDSNGKLVVTCKNCKNILIDFCDFENHVLEEHFDPLSIVKIEIMNSAVVPNLVDEIQEFADCKCTDVAQYMKNETFESQNHGKNSPLVKTAVIILEDCVKSEKVSHDNKLKDSMEKNSSHCCPDSADLEMNIEKKMRSNRDLDCEEKESKKKRKKSKESVTDKINESGVKKSDVLENCDKAIGSENVLCLYCGESFSAKYFQHHQSQRKCGKCPACLTIVSDLFRHVSKFHKEYVEEKRRLKEKVISRQHLTEEELALKRQQTEQNIGNECKSNTGDESEDITLNTIELQEDQKDNIKNGLQCKYCDKTFKFEGTIYKKHLRQHETKSDTCKICGKSFKYLYRLKKHMRLHTGERPYKCEICSVSFNESTNLKAHFINRHTEGLSIKCSYENCDKIFKTDRRRKYHEVYAHTDKYKNLCKECGLIFRTSGALNEHTKKKHMKYEDREFSCKYCEKKFAFKFELIPHEMKHSGQKKHQCEECDKGFIARKSFKRHCRTVHGKELEEMDIDRS